MCCDLGSACDLHLLTLHWPGGALPSSPHVIQKLVPTPSFFPTCQTASCPGHLDPETPSHTLSSLLQTPFTPAPPSPYTCRWAQAPSEHSAAARRCQALTGTSLSQVSALVFPSCLHPQAPRVGPSRVLQGCHLSRVSPQRLESDPNFWPCLRADVSPKSHALGHRAGGAARWTAPQTSLNYLAERRSQEAAQGLARQQDVTEAALASGSDRRELCSAGRT